MHERAIMRVNGGAVLAGNTQTGAVGIPFTVTAQGVPIAIDENREVWVGQP